MKNKKQTKFFIIFGIIFLAVFAFVIFYVLFYFEKKISIAKYEEKFIPEFNVISKYYQILYKNYNYTFDCGIYIFNSTDSLNNFLNIVENVSKNYLNKSIENITVFYSDSSEYIASFLIKENRVFYCSTKNKDEKALIFITKYLTKL
ncbi:MAG: hypothetical protein QXP34_02290 [Candidatus Aenigmatarchaeota archaeon]